MQTPKYKIGDVVAGSVWWDSDDKKQDMGIIGVVERILLVGEARFYSLVGSSYASIREADLIEELCVVDIDEKYKWKALPLKPKESTL